MCVRHDARGNNKIRYKTTEWELTLSSSTVSWFGHTIFGVFLLPIRLINITKRYKHINNIL